MENNRSGVRLEHLDDTRVFILEVKGSGYQGLSRLHLAVEWRTDHRVEGGGSKMAVEATALVQVRVN